VANLTAEVLTAEGIRLGQHAATKGEAIDQCGRLLLALGAVDEPYLAAMHERERSVSTFIGEEVAIPHGTDESRRHVRRTALGFLQYPDGIDWDGNRVSLCITIAADGDQHLSLLASLATILQEPGQAEELRRATDVDTVLALLAPARKEMSA
jgi:mannitol/fructose-specific phosphotransferase system IIA component